MKNPSITFDLSLNMARQVLYRFAGLSLLDPRAGAWERLNALRDDPLLFEAAALFRNLLTTARPTQAEAVEAPMETVDPRLVLARLPVSARALNIEYENTFGLLVSSNCPPYEMEYVNSKFTFQRSNTLADISGFYRAFGLTASATRPERPDHIVLELEFMASLLALERQAADLVSGEAADRQQVCRNAQARFLQDHLAWWVPAFGMLLAKQNGQGFYAAAGAFLAALIAVEGARLGLPPESGQVAPTTVERPEFCEGCQLAN
jgi:TorA maturation chaperone TorD